ncbi:MAG: hypothetical protein GY850_07750 [bacterium]|nr:hypothetical protein [bacterium]
MENQIITGIGCFAEPAKLSRIFLRMVQTYTLGKLGDIDWVNDCKSDETEGRRLLKALIAGTATGHNLVTPGADDRCPNKKITGFFLTLKDQRLKLSILAKKGDRQQEWHSAILNEFTKIRHKRLN